MCLTSDLTIGEFWYPWLEVWERILMAVLYTTYQQKLIPKAVNIAE